MGRVGLVAAYPLEQELFAIQSEALHASAKIAVLLCGEVVLSYSSILASPMTYQLVRDAKDAMLAGLLSVDRRAAYESYAALARDNPDKWEVSAHAREAIAFLDDHARRIVPFQNVNLSQLFASNVKNLTYLAERHKPGGAHVERLGALFAEIDAQHGISLEWILGRLKQLGFDQELADSATLVYHFLGGLSVDASASWPKKYNDTLRQLRLHQDDFVNAPSLPKAEAELGKRYALFRQDAYAGLMAQAEGRAINCDFDELPEVLMLDRSRIAGLSWPVITKLAQSSEARAVHALVDQYSRGRDPEGGTLVLPQSTGQRLVAAVGDLANVIRAEYPRQLRSSHGLKSAAERFGIGSLLVAGAGCLFDPNLLAAATTDASTASILAVGGLFLGVSGFIIDKFQQGRYRRVAALGEKIVLAADAEDR